MNDDGIYILTTPSERDTSRPEYRVAYLAAKHNITWHLDQASCSDAIDPKVVKPHFNKVAMFTDKLDAEEEAYRLADSLYLVKPPTYRIYISTPFGRWSKPEYA